MSSRSIIPNDQISALVEKLRAEGKTIATLNGSFDLLHAGHLHMIREAAAQADVLIVALNTDRSIKEYKSPARPICPLEDRLAMMDALSFVDYVTWFDETDPRAFLSVVKPDVHINGSEYGADCIEADTVRTHGGRIHVVELIPGHSTSNLLERIVNLCAL
jgi:D-glycero-beta-D-manno-heptose 1-phosphate adenylyltransferase